MISIAIPSYKEAQNLPTLIRAIRTSLDKVEHEMIIVDDNSPDGSGDLAEELAREYGNIKVVHREKKMGVASAIADGVSAASGDIIGTLNADMLNAPELLPTMLQYAGQYDVIIGSRYAEGGRFDKGVTRGTVSKGAQTLARVLNPRLRKVRDPLSGFFFFKREVIADANISSKSLAGNISIGVKFLPELLVKGRYNSVIEVPYSDEKREAGKSKFSFRDCVAYLRQMIRLRLRS